MNEVVLKRFETPDETREFDKGKFEIVHIGGLTIGRATYQPGWKWSENVSPIAGTKYCEVEHVGLVISGHAVAAMDGDNVVDLHRACSFTFLPKPTAAGLLATNRMCLSTFLVRTNIQNEQRFLL